MSKEAMKLALEALEGLEALLLSMGLTHLIVYGDVEKAITALREALAEQPAQTATYTCGVCGVSMQMEQPAQQEPVATLWQHGETGRTRITMPGDITDCDARWFKAADLYTSPPAQRKPLTDEQIDECWYQSGGLSMRFARAIEAAHGIKEQP